MKKWFFAYRPENHQSSNWQHGKSKKKLPSRLRQAALGLAAVAYALGMVWLTQPPGKPAAAPTPPKVRTWPLQPLPLPSRPVADPAPAGKPAAAPATVPASPVEPLTLPGKLSVADPALANIVAAGRAAASGAAPAGPKPGAADDAGDGSVIYRRAADAVAWLIATDKAGKQWEGTGVLIDAERGYILTACHVVRDSVSIAAVFPATSGGEVIPDRKFYDAGFKQLCIGCVAVAKDAGRDLALLRLDTPPQGREGIALASTGARPGQWLCLIGNGGRSDVLWQFIGGYVRQVHVASYRLTSGQDIRARIVETDLAVHPGDSGGPLLDRTGRLVGIHSSDFPTLNRVEQSIDLSDIRAFLRVAGYAGEAAGGSKP